MIDIEQYLAEKKRVIDETLEALMPEPSADAQVLARGMRYSIFSGGKRIRPILTVAAAECLGDVSQDVMRIACAVEIVHTYSLIHDDLPAMDDDDFRRGKPTLHKVIGVAEAILVGDALLPLAFETIAGLSETPDNVKTALVKELSSISGAGGLVSGQLMDIAVENQAPEREMIRTIHRLKTAALIRCAVRMGGLTARVNEGELAALSQYGESVGMAFQMVDDILDVIEDAATESDRREKKSESSNYAAVFGLEEAGSEASRLTEKALEALQAFDHRADPLRGFARYLLGRTA